MPRDAGTAEIATLREEREILKTSRGVVRTRDRFDPATVFEFMKAHQAAHSIPTVCRVRSQAFRTRSAD
jgi:hypothetical protein